jgi:hypothetical protein
MHINIMNSTGLNHSAGVPVSVANSGSLSPHQVSPTSSASVNVSSHVSIQDSPPSATAKNHQEQRKGNNNRGSERRANREREKEKRNSKEKDKDAIVRQESVEGTSGLSSPNVTLHQQHQHQHHSHHHHSEISVTLPVVIEAEKSLSEKRSKRHEKEQDKTKEDSPQESPKQQHSPKSGVGNTGSSSSNLNTSDSRVMPAPQSQPVLSPISAPTPQQQPITTSATLQSAVPPNTNANTIGVVQLVTVRSSPEKQVVVEGKRM